MINVLKFSVLFLFIQMQLHGNQIDKSLNVIEKTNKELQNYQGQIDLLDEKNRSLLNEYKYTNKELQNTIKYNKQLEQLISSQEDEIKSVNKQLIEIEQTHKNIYPLMDKMIVSLEKLIQSDIPFLLEERTNRVNSLKNSLDRADIKTAEKFRIILEAFKIEYDYANTIESYEDLLEGKTYTFLRLGRTALYYQSLDQKDHGYWNNQSKQWVNIDDTSAKSNIRKAIKIAQKQRNVELLELPFLTLKDNR